MGRELGSARVKKLRWPEVPSRRGSDSASCACNGMGIVARAAPTTTAATAVEKGVGPRWAVAAEEARKEKPRERERERARERVRRIWTQSGPAWGAGRGKGGAPESAGEGRPAMEKKEARERRKSCATRERERERETDSPGDGAGIPQTRWANRVHIRIYAASIPLDALSLRSPYADASRYIAAMKKKE
jgi:hypothetical protein